jgi:hypothetical protein
MLERNVKEVSVTFFITVENNRKVLGQSDLVIGWNTLQLLWIMLFMRILSEKNHCTRLVNTQYIHTYVKQEENNQKNVHILVVRLWVLFSFYTGISKLWSVHGDWFTKNILLEHSHTYIVIYILSSVAAFVLQWRTWVVEVWPAKL